MPPNPKSSRPLTSTFKLVRAPQASFVWVEKLTQDYRSKTSIQLEHEAGLCVRFCLVSRQEIRTLSPASSLLQDLGNQAHRFSPRMKLWSGIRSSQPRQKRNWASRTRNQNTVSTISPVRSRPARISRWLFIGMCSRMLVRWLGA